MKRSSKATPHVRDIDKVGKTSNRDAAPVDSIEIPGSRPPRCEPSGAEDPPLADGGNDHQAPLSADAIRIRGELKLVAYRILVDQELERRDISQWLNDDIAQLLLGIGVRLAAMQQEATVDTEKLINDIASTRRQAEQSVTAARRIADTEKKW
ncbi:MAG: histidine kinase [Planctomycetota bacterium]|nr:histidine kinase [Planctomycetota bacterium]